LPSFSATSACWPPQSQSCTQFVLPEECRHSSHRDAVGKGCAVEHAVIMSGEEHSLFKLSRVLKLGDADDIVRSPSARALSPSLFDSLHLVTDCPIENLCCWCPPTCSALARVANALSLPLSAADTPSPASRSHISHTVQTYQGEYAVVRKREHMRVRTNTHTHSIRPPPTTRETLSHHTLLCD
jgi:hypothetical protein